jgi:hypothetical protein
VAPVARCDTETLQSEVNKLKDELKEKLANPKLTVCAIDMMMLWDNLMHDLMKSIAHRICIDIDKVFP